MRSRCFLYIATRGNAEGKPYVDLQLRPNELQAIGHVTAQWAFLEFLILRETRSLARYLQLETPADATATSFRRRRELWKSLAQRALASFDEELHRSLDCIERVANLANERHRITHDIIEYDRQDENRLRALPRGDFQKLGWPLNAERIEKTAMQIARLSHDVLSIHRDPEPVSDAARRWRHT
jgi:hypothetical protein